MIVAIKIILILIWFLGGFVFWFIIKERFIIDIESVINRTEEFEIVLTTQFKIFYTAITLSVVIGIIIGLLK